MQLYELADELNRPIPALVDAARRTGLGSLWGGSDLTAAQADALRAALDDPAPVAEAPPPVPPGRSRGEPAPDRPPAATAPAPATSLWMPRGWDGRKRRDAVVRSAWHSWFAALAFAGLDALLIVILVAVNDHITVWAAVPLAAVALALLGRAALKGWAAWPHLASSGGQVTGRLTVIFFTLCFVAALVGAGLTVRWYVDHPDRRELGHTTAAAATDPTTTVTTRPATASTTTVSAAPAPAGPTASLVLGRCYRLSNANDSFRPTDLTPAGCSEPDAYLLVHSVNRFFGAPDGTAYSANLVQRGLDRCREVLQQRYRDRLTPDSRYVALVPVREQWDQGQRWLACFLRP